MLEHLPREQSKYTVYRLLAVEENLIKRLMGRGIRRVSAEKTVDALVRAGIPFTAKELVDEVFNPKIGFPTPFPPKRFSDGSIPVYYSALDDETCIIECKYWISKWISGLIQKKERSLYYSSVRAVFNGISVDLLKFLDELPLLVDDPPEGYIFCQRIGREASTSNIDGLLTPSARKTDGVCTPVFRRSAIIRIRSGKRGKFSYVNDQLVFEWVS